MQSRSYENAPHRCPLRFRFRCHYRLFRFHNHQRHPSRSDGHCRRLISFPNPDRHLMRPFYQISQMLSDTLRTWGSNQSQSQKHPKGRRRASLVTLLRRPQELRLSVTDLIVLEIDPHSPCQQLQARVHYVQSGLVLLYGIPLGAVPQLAINKPHQSALSGRSPLSVDHQQTGNVALRLSPEQGPRLCRVRTSASIHGNHHTACDLNTSPTFRRAHLIPKPTRKWSQCNRRPHQLNPGQESQERRLLKIYLWKGNQRVLSDLTSLQRSVC
jgi:hypothetical protein